MVMEHECLGMAESQTTDAPQSTMELLQNELEKKWEREAAEEAREERLADEPIGPERPRMPADEQAFYDLADLEAGDRLEWDDGEVSEVVATVPAQQTIDEIEPLGDIVHVRVIEEMDDADNWDDSPRVGEQYDIRDYVVGGAIADGRLEVGE